MTKIIGIINVTPDSFSDGGACFDADFAIQVIAKMIEEGTDVIDIGAESTRPGATPVMPVEEWQRLEPVLKMLKQFDEVEFSVDTRHAETARRALDAGIHWINDVSGFSDPDMVSVVKNSNCKLVMMHSLTLPADKKIIMTEPDVVSALLGWAKSRLEDLRVAGIPSERIIFDPGIGFGKSAAQSLAILREVKRFSALDVPILIGHSRKSFLNNFPLPLWEGVRGRGYLNEKSFSEDPPPPRPSPTRGEGDDATLIASQYLAARGVDYLRVHNVARHKQMLAIMRALYG